MKRKVKVEKEAKAEKIRGKEKNRLKRFVCLYNFLSDLCMENVAANREAMIARGKAGLRVAKASTAMKSSWTVSVTREARPIRRSGREQKKERRSRHWVTKMSSLEYFRNYAKKMEGKDDWTCLQLLFLLTMCRQDRAVWERMKSL